MAAVSYLGSELGSWGIFSWEVQRYQETWLGVKGWAQLSLTLGIGGGMVCAFGARLLLPRGFAATAEFRPSLLLLTVGEPLLARVVIEVGLFNTEPHWEGPSPSTWVPQGKPGTPTPSPSPKGASPGCLQQLLAGAQLPLPSPTIFCHCFRFLLHFVCHPKCACLCCSSLLLQGSYYSPFHHPEGH